MIVRIEIDNVFSFGRKVEFNTFPNKRLQTLNHHKYALNGIELLKMTSIYGANGAGKSNLIKAVKILRDVVLEEEGLSLFRKNAFRFDKIQRPQSLAIEFIHEGQGFYYGLEVFKGGVKREELYLSGLGVSDDKLVYVRTTDNAGETSLTFSDEYEADEKSQLLKSILLEDFVKPNEPILKLLSNRSNPFLQAAKVAFSWFKNNLVILSPHSSPEIMAHFLDVNSGFQKYATDFMRSLNIGISDVKCEKINLRELPLGDQYDDLIEDFINSNKEVLQLTLSNGQELLLAKEGDEIWVKEIQVEHTGGNTTANFDLEEESDGTVRLLHFLPAFKDLISNSNVYLIDELERSIHPLLMKELVKKFSEDTETKGQLIFTTHESHLLDQKIFRTDEIWFAEKDPSGATEFYSLDSFKQHKTIDVRKGYFNGRFGAIPFLGNLEDLNWHEYDFEEPTV